MSVDGQSNNTITAHKIGGHYVVNTLSILPFLRRSGAFVIGLALDRCSYPTPCGEKIELPNYDGYG